MGETCEICGREIAKKATDPSSWCWRQLLYNDHDVSADYECYKAGFEHLRSLYREWQETVDRANDKAARAEADKEHAQLRWRELVLHVKPLTTEAKVDPLSYFRATEDVRDMLCEGIGEPNCQCHTCEGTRSLEKALPQRDGLSVSALYEAYEGVSKQRDEAYAALSELVNTIGDGSFVHIECSDAEAARKLEAIEAKCRQLMRVNP